MIERRMSHQAAYIVSLHIVKCVLIGVDQHELVLVDLNARSNVEVLGNEIARSVWNLVFSLLKKLACPS
jgi:hypothetical protein